MRAAIALLILAGCSAPAGPQARLTIYGDELRVEPWTPVVVERGHLHTRFSDEICPGSQMLALSDAALEVLGKQQDDSGQFDRAVSGMMAEHCARSHGRAHGGPGRLVLGLFRRDGVQPEEALIVDVPRLKKNETARRFKPGEFAASWERPPGTVAASLERGWVNVLRLDRDRYEFELFLVLAPAPGEGTPTQVVARLEASARAR